MRLGHRIGFTSVLAAFSLIGGCGTPSLLITPVANTYELNENVVAPARGWTGSKVAIIEVDGTLLNVRVGGLLDAGENPLSLFTQALNRAAEDDSIKAVVLRVNSPGGSVTTSDTMYDEVLRFKAKTHKPVIVSAQELDASGAYYLSCAADKIVVNPTSLVGSIGVIFETIEFANTMDKLGIQAITIKSAELKDMGSPFKHLTDHEREVMQGMVDEYYARFKSIVTANRAIKEADMKMVTDGRVFTGARAVELGLADQIGRLDDAIDLARKMANSPGAAVIMFERPYGYSGSIYAQTPIPQPKAQTSELSVKLPGTDGLLPSGFYYLWQP